MTALSAEVIWTRLLSLLFGATVYTFSLILAVFLVGLGIGSSLGAAIGARHHASARRARLVSDAALRGDGLGGVHADAVAAVLADQPVDLDATPWFNFQLDLVRCFWVVLPGAILWGASFPLALASVAAPGQDPARLVGGVYAANTVGAIVGSLVASLLLVAGSAASTRSRC